MSDDETAEAFRSGEIEAIGAFDSVEEADAFAKKRSKAGQGKAMPYLNLPPEAREMASADSSVAQFMPRKRTKMDIIGALFEALATGVGTATGNRGLVELGGRGAAMRDRAEQQRQKRAQQIEDEQRKRAQALSDQERSIALQEKRRDKDFQQAILERAMQSGRELPENTASEYNVKPGLLAAGRPKTPQEKAEEALLVQLGLIDDPRYQRVEEYEREKVRTAEQETSDMIQKRQIAIQAAGIAGRKGKDDEPKPVLIDEEGRLTPEGKYIRDRSRLGTEGSTSGGLYVHTGGTRDIGPKPAGRAAQSDASQLVAGIVMNMSKDLPHHARLIEDKMNELGRTGGTDADFNELGRLAMQIIMNPDDANLILEKLERIGRARTPTPSGTPGVGRMAGGP